MSSLFLSPSSYLATATATASFHRVHRVFSSRYFPHFQSLLCTSFAFCRVTLPKNIAVIKAHNYYSYHRAICVPFAKKKKKRKTYANKIRVGTYIPESLLVMVNRHKKKKKREILELQNWKERKIGPLRKADPSILLYESTKPGATALQQKDINDGFLCVLRSDKI